MHRDFRTCSAWLIGAGLLVFAGAQPASAQERRQNRIDVEQYTVDAEINPATSALAVKAAVRFTPLDDNLNTATFELNNALNVSRITTDQGQQIPATRNQQDSTVRLTFDQSLPKGKPATITFEYDGRLTGNEESPVYGIKFAAIHPDYSYLMYPARWLPVNGYTTDRFAAEVHVSVPAGYTVVGTGMDSRTGAGDKNVFNFKFTRSSFPGSIAVIKGDPVKVQSEGVTTTLYFHEAEAAMVQPYGEKIGQMMSHFTGLFGIPPYANLTVVETDDGSPNGYAAPGLLFLSPHAIGTQPNLKVLANQVSRQWWEEIISPTTRNHLWLTNGLAAYSELLWSEHENGQAAMNSALPDVMGGFAYS